jgi:hypothetical protein
VLATEVGVQARGLVERAGVVVDGDCLVDLGGRRGPDADVLAHGAPPARADRIAMRALPMM